MADDKSKAAQYWSTNLRLILGSLVVWALVSYGCGILFRGVLSGIPVGGADLGFWFAQQGSIYVFIVLIWAYVFSMNRLDEKYDVHE